MSIVFKWPKGPNEVIVTGTFDKWSQQLELIKQVNGNFELEVPLPNKEERIEFKFIVDGEWRVSDSYWTVVDESGNVNNYVEINGGTVKSKDIESNGVVGKTIIPESGLSVRKEGEGKGEGEGEVANDVANEVANEEVPVAGVEPEKDEKVGAVENVVAPESAKEASKEKHRKYVKRVVKSGEAKVEAAGSGDAVATNNSDSKKDKKKSFFSRLLKK